MRTTVEGKLDDVVDRVAKYVFAETDPSVLLTVENGVPRSVASIDLDGRSLKRQYREEIRGEVIRLKSSFRDQFDHVVAAAAGDDDHVDRREAFVREDLFYADYGGDEREAFRGDLEAYFDDMVATIEPMLAAEVAADGGTPGFWDAVTETYSEEEAREHLETIARPREIIRRYGEDCTLVMDLRDSTAPIDELDHTVETVRTVTEGIDEVVEAESDLLAAAYGG